VPRPPTRLQEPPARPLADEISTSAEETEDVSKDKLFKTQKLRCRKAIRHAGLPLAEAFVLDRIVDTQLKLNPTQEKRYRELERREGKEIQEMVITWEDALADRYAKGRAEGEARGEARGEAKGRAEGELQAARRAVVLLARHRHDELPDGFEDKLEAIHSLQRLYEILEQVSDGASLEELELVR